MKRKTQLKAGLAGCVVLLVVGAVMLYRSEFRSGRAAFAAYEARLAILGESLDRAH